MRISFSFGADARGAQGKGASRRLRRSGKVPAILYGGHKEAQPLVLDQQNLLTMIGDERFYSSIVQLKIDGTAQEAIVKDVQMHPARNVVVHVDLQRVLENEAIRLHLPIHFKGESVSPGVKTQGGIVSHMRADVEVSCLPKDLPEFLELDLSEMSLNDTKFLADIPLPPGVTIPELAHRNTAVVSIHAPRAAEPEPVAAEAAAVPAEGAAPAAAAGAAPAGGAAPGAEAKKGEEKKEAAPAKKEGGKK
ncbi:MAG: 50S ribosomal protein L25/general stress protein Ctc [Gammaproteobacteria bacterium]|nr:50S ribosomal protein L25/general stress protein Ctc [Gammaproteobacteria bacterium]MDE2261599.1 50S ribosomal protein L25/general stress protein Ctc [Gammaproteobacteria bacterium]